MGLGGGGGDRLEKKADGGESGGGGGKEGPPTGTALSPMEAIRLLLPTRAGKPGPALTSAPGPLEMELVDWERGKLGRLPLSAREGAVAPPSPPRPNSSDLLRHDSVGRPSSFSTALNRDFPHGMLLLGEVWEGDRRS